MVFKFSSYNGEVIRGRKDGWMKKRVIQLFLGIAVLSYVFTGCSHQGSTDDKETDSVNSGEVIVEEQEQDFIDQESQGSIELSGMLQVDGKSENSESESISTSSENQNVVLVKNGGTLTMTDGKLTKSGDTSSADESNYYGVNAVFATTAGSESSISKSEITSSAEGANAVFATGTDALIHADHVKISTSGNSSRGLKATYGGRIKAENIEVTTSGTRCAPVAAEKSGSVFVEGGTVLSSGTGSPCIFAAGTVTAEKLEGSADDSQILMIEGGSTAVLNGCDLSGSGENGVLLYRSSSENEGEGASNLKASDTKLTSRTEGPLFYVTNTKADIILRNSELKYEGNVLTKVSGNSINNWGTPGSNGGNLTLTAIDQKLKGRIVCDEISTVNLRLKESSSFSGSINSDNKGKYIKVSLAEDAVWKLSGDAYVNVLTNADESCRNIESGGYSIYYDSADSANSWLAGRTISLAGGGKIVPRG